jgi:hypothetical protein
MSNKEVLELMIMGKKISIACPPKDKEGLIKAAEILNEQIDSIPDKSNALILTSLDLAFKSQLPQEGHRPLEGGRKKSKRSCFKDRAIP